MTNRLDTDSNLERQTADLHHSALVWCLGHPVSKAVPEMGFSTTTAVVDLELVKRVQSAYRRAVSSAELSTSAWDVSLRDIKRPIHDALTAPSEVQAAEMLRDPASNSHFWGFDAICKAPDGSIEPHENVLKALNNGADFKLLYAIWLQDALISLGEAVGSRRLFYPETRPEDYGNQAQQSTVDEILDGIEASIGTQVRFPNPYPGELGLVSRRGVIGFRSLQALYQAWRLKQLAGDRPDFRVIEIGAGLGRTAYFAVQLGLCDYTIVDIPLTNAAQAYFLGKTLGSDRIGLYGEIRDGGVRILPPQAIAGMTETFDLMLNVDSFTELAPSVMTAYWAFARSNADALLSINHELNPNLVRTLFAGDPTMRWTRHPYWMRRGYVEEYASWPHRRSRRADMEASEQPRWLPE